MERRAWLGAVVLLSSAVAAQVYPKEMEERPGNFTVKLGNFPTPTTFRISFDRVEPVTINAFWHRARYDTVPAQGQGGFFVVNIDMGVGCKECKKYYGLPTDPPSRTTVFAGQVSLVPVPSLFARGEGAERPEPWTIRYPLSTPFVVAVPNSLAINMDFPAVPGGYYQVDSDLIEVNNVINGPRSAGPTQAIAGTGCGRDSSLPTFAWSPTLGYHLTQETWQTSLPIVDVISLSTTSSSWQIPNQFGGCGSFLDPASSIAIPFVLWRVVPVPWFSGSMVVQRILLNGSVVLGASPTLRAALPIVWQGELAPGFCATHTNLWARAPWLVVPTRFNP